MSDGFGDKVTGDAKELGGKVQEGVGNLTGDTETQARGEANQAEGKGQQMVGGVKDAIGDAKDKVGDAMDDPTNKR